MKTDYSFKTNGYVYTLSDWELFTIAMLTFVLGLVVAWAA